MTIKRPVWSFFIPRTGASMLRGTAQRAPALMFAASATALLLKQSYYRPQLIDEDANTWDRIERRSYVALPDGRMALVYPVIMPDVSLKGLWYAFVDSLNPLP